MTMNMELSDDLMEQASGGVASADPIGYICEATVMSGPGSSTLNGETKTDYSVQADNGKNYLAYWNYRSVLSTGDIVQLIHDASGFYYLEPIMV